MDALAILLIGVIGLVTTVVVLGAGYWLGGWDERQRRKNRLVDDRIREVGDAITHLSQIDATLGQPSRLRDLMSDRVGVLQEGGAAAHALGASGLAITMTEALGLLKSFMVTPDEKIALEYATKLAEARTEYELLRTKLV